MKCTAKSSKFKLNITHRINTMSSTQRQLLKKQKHFHSCGKKRISKCHYYEVCWCAVSCDIVHKKKFILLLHCRPLSPLSTSLRRTLCTQSQHYWADREPQNTLDKSRGSQCAVWCVWEKSHSLTVNVHRVKAWGKRSIGVTFCRGCDRKIVRGLARAPESLLKEQSCSCWAHWEQDVA